MTLSYFVQMAGPDGSEFCLGSGGHSHCDALVRGFARRKRRPSAISGSTARGTVYMLLPISLIGALFLCSQGVVQNCKTYTDSNHGRGEPDHRPRPGGVPDVDQAARHEWRRFLQRQLRASVGESHADFQLLRGLSILLIPGALTYTFGKMVRTRGRVGRSSPPSVPGRGIHCYGRAGG